MYYQSGELAKGMITNLETDKSVTLMYNPSSLMLHYRSSWHHRQMNGGDYHIEAGDTYPIILRFRTVFDGYESGQDVRTYIDPIVSLIRPCPETKDKVTGLSRPPRISFSWGVGLRFEGVLSDVLLVYTMFLADGTPVRAKMRLTIEGQ